MIEAIGGFNSESYSEFKKICIKIYNCLRKHMRKKSTKNIDFKLLPKRPTKEIRN